MDKQKVNQVYDIINRNIVSSHSLLQLEAAERLVDLFKRQNTSPELSEKLEMNFIRKAETLHYFEWKKFREFGSDAA
ncbi:MAG TPA: hypothetical protein VK826_20520 [Bacteroidia bacterium]|nr:hypothetical protein [Bacteroidia bacterium]